MEGAARAHERDPHDMSIEQVHTAWLAAGARGDAETMRRLLQRHPQWLDLQRRVGTIPGSATTDFDSVRHRFCSWENFHLATIGASALHTAAWEGSRDIVGLLLEAGQDPDTSDDAGLTPMMVSILRYNVVVMRCVFRNGQAVRRNIVVDCREEERQLLNKVTTVVGLLLRFGAHVDARSQEGSSALHYAANSDALDVARMLLDAGAEIDGQDEHGMTPLHQCINEDNLLVANLLVSRGAQIDLEDTEGETPLTFALKKRRVNMLQIILNHHHMVVTSLRRDFAADMLFRAVEYESEGAMHLIVDGEYASITVRNDAGETSLHRAIVKCSPQLIELLADLDSAGDSLTMQTLAGDTPVHYAARYGSTPAMETLLQCLSVVFGDLQALDEAANPLNTTNNAGVTPLFTVGADRSVASTLDERDAIVELLLHHGAWLFPRSRVLIHSGPAAIEQIALHEQVRRGLTLWIQETSDQGLQNEDEEAAHRSRMLLTELFVEWVASAAPPALLSPSVGRHSVEWSDLSAVLRVVIVAGYAREFVPLLMELPLRLTAMPALLLRLDRVSREPNSHSLLQQLHFELSEALTEIVET